MKNKKVKRQFDGMALEYWGGIGDWATNALVNGWMDYREGNLFLDDQREGMPYVSLTANQLKGVK